ncbi:MAG: nickel pincer cofactor biosynthesis protein LarB [Gemmatimonadetes bacterium]|jgi:pyridinium-3,5-biscarboxylic acid mononucleotide synthase|nr:nickel pincer cofactor biosynthesis protein LarB [Gemmatimonadota bacterium]MBT6148986.1 nickel pincer cofactor biosynthesis protein LarB [Gemmatimonadota bacterium]MBT7859755.1 nickel pincer cofactor biosynthesis protein LarB [Gemmatimonadota bacterium]
MDTNRLADLLQAVSAGDLAPDDALAQLRSLPFEDLGFAHVDHHRAIRTGYPETIFCQGKTPGQVVAIAERLAAAESIVLATRVEADTAAAVLARFPEADHDEVARTVVIRPVSDQAAERADQEPDHQSGGRGLVLVVSAGTSDLPVAQEAIVTSRTMGARTEGIFDVGVAGIHRLLAYRERLGEARAIVVVAGMEGALASVVGGLVDAPVVAVPTSVGYGASFGGLAALLTMLNSCASGVLTCNIDNGYGAGYAAALINNRSVDGR